MSSKFNLLLKKNVLELNTECLLSKQHVFLLIFKFDYRKLNLLSFGEEAEEEEKELASVKQKIKSSHDVLNDPRLLKEEIPDSELVIRPSYSISLFL